MSNNVSESVGKIIRVGALETGSGHRDYWSDFSVKELSPDWVATTKGRGVAKMRSRRPEHGEFVVPVAPLVAAHGFRGDEARNAWDRTCGIADQLQATRLLLRTPASFRPTADNEKRLVDFFSPERVGTLSINWWAEGLWESQPELTERICQQIGMVPVIDPLALDADEEAPMTPGFYWRIMGGRGMRRGLNDFELEHLAEDALARQHGTVIFAGPAVAGDAKRFVRMLRLEMKINASDEDG